MKHIKKTLTAIALLHLWSPAAFAGEISPNGLWKTQDGRALVEIGACEKDEALKCGKIVDLHWPNDPVTGKPKLDHLNEDDKLKTRPLMGLQMLEGFAKDDAGDNAWTDGTIYSPREGKTYTANMTVINDNTLEVRGYVLAPIFGKTQTWTRMPVGSHLEKGDPKDDKPAVEE